MANYTIKERTFMEFMKRFDRDEDLGNPFVTGMKMMVSSLISSNGLDTALDALNLCLGSDNIVVYSQEFKAIKYVKKYPKSLTNIIRSHVKKHEEKDFLEEFDKVICNKKRNVIIYTIHTERHYFYIVILDNDIIDESLKMDVIDVSRIAFYTIFDHYELVRQLKLKAQVDALTGVKNRSMYQKVTKNLPKFAPNVTFMVCDLFSLKSINDKYGHPAGDTYLIRAANCMEKQFPKCVYKVGGDEFIVIVPGRVDVEKKMTIANEELMKSMKRSIKKAQEIYHINYGYIYGNTSEITALEFYKEADGLLSQDKAEFYKKLNVDRRKN